MSEVSIEEKACSLIYEHLGIKGSKLKVKGESGYPDRIFWLPGGKPFLIEFKKPGEEPRPSQIRIHDYLRSLGYKVEVHDNAIDALEATIKAVDSTRLSKESRQILAGARRMCVILRSRSGEN